MREKVGDALLWQLLPKRDGCNLKLKQNRKTEKKKKYSSEYVCLVLYLYGEYTAINIKLTASEVIVPSRTHDLWYCASALLNHIFANIHVYQGSLGRNT